MSSGGPPSRVLAIHAAFRDAQDKFDHLVLGIIIAICAYLAQGIDFERIGANVGTMFLLALLSFGASGLFGFKRIEMVIVGYRLNHQFLEAADKGHAQDAQHAKEVLAKAARRAVVYYRLRNGFLLSGFLVYLGAKVFSAYA